MAKLSIFGQQQGKEQGMPETEPVYNKPFQRYVGRDEVNRRASSFSPRQRMNPAPVAPGVRALPPAPGVIQPSQAGTPQAAPGTPQPVPQAPAPMGQSYSDVVNRGGGGVIPGGMQPQTIPGAIQPFPAPPVMRNRAFTPSIYGNPFQQ